MTPLDLTIYNIRDHSIPVANGAVLVDRGTDYGNPFVMHRESQRTDACDKFEQYAMWRLSIEPDWLKPLKGKHLACWCAPKRCHAETLLRLANE